ncbi:hypothetical protein PanWU01x14_262400, partial [Parasponia andersonii]
YTLSFEITPHTKFISTQIKRHYHSKNTLSPPPIDPKSLKLKQTRKARESKLTAGNVSEIDPSGRKGLLFEPGELNHVPKSRDLNGTLYPIGPDSRSDGVRDFEDIDPRRHIAILKVPPNRNSDVSGLFFVAPRERMRRRRVTGEKKKKWMA